jgi:hypothetical protein
MVQEFLFDKTSLAGPVDPEALKSIERQHTLDTGYHQLIHEFHGGIPASRSLSARAVQPIRIQTYQRLITVLSLSK